MLSIDGHFLCLFTLKRRFFVAEVAVAQVALAEPEKSHITNLKTALRMSNIAVN